MPKLTAVLKTWVTRLPIWVLWGLSDVTPPVAKSASWSLRFAYTRSQCLFFYKQILPVWTFSLKTGFPHFPQVNGRPDHKVYFYDVEMDTVTHFDFFTGRPSSGISQPEESERYILFVAWREPGLIVAHGNRSWFSFEKMLTRNNPFAMQSLAKANLFFRQQFEGTELSGRCPMSHFWDESEPRLFVCETVPISSEASSHKFLDMASTVLNDVLPSSTAWRSSHLAGSQEATFNNPQNENASL